MEQREHGVEEDADHKAEAHALEFRARDDNRHFGQTCDQYGGGEEQIGDLGIIDLCVNEHLDAGRGDDAHQCKAEPAENGVGDGLNEL